METAGAEDMPDDAERKGLGTPATRAATLEKLVSAGFVQRKKKQLISTEKGRNLIAVLPDNIKSPILTAEWESMLKQVEHGELSATSFMDQIADKAFFSLDYGDDIEREAVLFTPTLQEIVERHLEEERVYQAISSLPEKQRQRVYAHYILGITLMDIAKMEGVSLHAVYESIQRGLRRLEKILEENF